MVEERQRLEFYSRKNKLNQKYKVKKTPLFKCIEVIEIMLKRKF